MRIPAVVEHLVSAFACPAQANDYTPGKMSGMEHQSLGWNILHSSFILLPWPRGRLRLHSTMLVAAFAGGLSLLPAAETPRKPLYPGLPPACSCESLTNLSLPNTVIESALVDASNRMCRVTAVVTHPPAGDHVEGLVWVAPVTLD